MIIYAGPLAYVVLGALVIVAFVVTERRRIRQRRARLAEQLRRNHNAAQATLYQASPDFAAFSDSHPFVSGGEH